ncbi:hypothetical protein M3J09_006693 [Ascochyta lentis]
MMFYSILLCGTPVTPLCCKFLEPLYASVRTAFLQASLTRLISFLLFCFVAVSALVLRAYNAEAFLFFKHTK